jgi:hypothetical protein
MLSGSGIIVQRVGQVLEDAAQSAHFPFGASLSLEVLAHLLGGGHGNAVRETRSLELDDDVLEVLAVAQVPDENVQRTPVVQRRKLLLELLLLNLLQVQRQRYSRELLPREAWSNALRLIDESFH